MSLRHAFGPGAVLVAVLITAAWGAETPPALDTKWISGSGDWTDVAHWSAGLPDPYKRAEIHGNSLVHVPDGRGRGGKIVAVTNLDDAGAGSLRAAMNTPGPRTVRFDVGGGVALRSPLRIEEPFVTVDGQNAPVIYDWGDTAGCGEFDRVNYIGNYLKPGPSTRKEQRLFHDGVDVVMPKSLYLANNILAGNQRVNEDNWLGVGYDRQSIGAPEPFPAPAVTTEQAESAYEHVLKEAGATPPKRDAVDERIVRETREGTGHIIKWVKDAGGWPDFLSATVLDSQEVRERGRAQNGLK